MTSDDRPDGVRRILHVAASPNGEAAFSWRLAERLLARLGGQTIRRRLDLEPPPPPTAEFARAMRIAQTAEAASAEPSLAISERLIWELELTDALVVSTPMHNFTLPATLKAWLDQIVRFGRTFESTPDGKIGKLQDRPTYVLIATGSPITPPAARQPDFLRPYLTEILACVGLRDVSFVAAEGAARDPDALAATFRAVDALPVAALSTPP